MSTFSGFNTGLSGLMSHQRALEVASQNIANMNTVGYTRQRAELVAQDPAGRAGLNSGTAVFNGGVNVDRIQRLGDIHLEARVREHSAEAGKQTAVNEAWRLAESSFTEPSEKGMSEALARLFNDFSEVGNQTNVAAAKSVLLEDAKSLVADINTAAGKVATAWQDMRTKVVGLVDEVNSAAAGVADLNDRILTAEVQGMPTGALVDEREKLLVELAGKIGATPQLKDNGSVDVLVGGHTIVTGKNTFPVRVEGSLSHQALAGYKAGDPITENTGPVRIVWTKTDSAISVDSGTIGGYLQGLDPADAGGALPTMAAKYDRLAQDVASTVNDILAENGSAPMFVIDDPNRAAATMRVAYTNGSQIDVAAPGEGAYGSGLADRINQAGLNRGGVSDRWSDDVIDIGVKTRSATRRADAAESTRAAAVDQLSAKTGVNLDEEVMTLMSAQKAYAGAARVITTLDTMFASLLAMGA